jgi:hypothetical protein
MNNRLGGALITLLSFTIFGILIWQWNVYEKQAARNLKQEHVFQHFTIHHNEKSIYVSQTISELKGEKYTLHIPEGITKVSCMDQKKGSECLNVKPENGQIHIRYNLPKQHDTYVFLNHWYITLEKVDVQHTTIDIIESSANRGIWVSNMNLLSQNSEKLIDYYFFEYDGQPTNLYWQKSPLNRYQWKNGTVIYSETAIKEKELFLENDFTFTRHPALVLTKLNSFIQSDSIIVFPLQDDLEKVKFDILSSMVWAEFLYKEHDAQKHAQVIAALMIETMPTDPHAKRMYQELTKQLDEKTRMEFLNQLFSKENLDGKVGNLDDLLGRIMGLKTSFFTDNRGKSFIPLMFYKEFDIHIGQEKLKNEKIYYDGNNSYFSFQKVMKSLGYKFEKMSDTDLYISNSYKSYRFYLDQNIFILNEEEYGLYENPFKVINDDIYIREDWLKKIFRLQIIEDEDRVKIL